MNIDMIRAARSRLSGHARVTPLLSSPFLDELAGRRILVKPECLQHTGSFKYRGARNALAALEPETRARGAIAFSSGNHAQGVALAAREFGVPAVIVMPADAPVLKLANTRGFGAEVVTFDRATEDRDEIGERLSRERGLSLVKPFDEPEVIAGQGTVGLEIAEQAADLGVTRAQVVVPCGGGGLTSGIALALADTAPGMTVHPVEPEGFDDVSRSLASGRHEVNSRLSGNICDAIITPSPGKLTLPIMSAHCGPGITVTEDEALKAMAQAFLRLKIVLEPGGAVALAAALSGKCESETVIAVASGGNVDPTIFAQAMATL
ncbi:threonine/serine dehydratase [Maritimibacter sp. DP1N21-5]|uniref:threonine ammonia-lyase n=1 Tax=Maritimibacter sp. DP1N21-5 TaxID=2836867 RepID=UPI001C45E3C2|nr:threonine/serine dehydratase [Maritimibacter sp. DP1N21-5]MBV7408611.1 threonine/serine dehydratase [Maritimibacter sp. DP1N21-5]